MPPLERPRAHTKALRAGAAALLALAAVAGGSCRDLLVGERIDALAELCVLLENCYGDEFSCAGLEGELASATPEARSEFLTAFNAEACLGSCPAARACLDLQPFCEPTGSCSDDRECCSWSRGEAACQKELGQCCKPTGVSCADGDLCCDSECREGTCGGVVCTSVGEVCASDNECCSHYCDGDRCAVLDCVLLGGECQTQDDCCQLDDGVTGPGAGVSCEEQHCVAATPPACFPEGEACSNSSECCEDANQACLMVQQEAMIYTACGEQLCEAGFPCTLELGCCQDFSCDGATLTCQPAVTCVGAGLACGAADICCVGSCLDGTCTEATCNLGLAPAGWQCQPFYYLDCGFCDCDCGAHDPDCDDPSLPVWCNDNSAPDGTTCDAQDQCVPP